MAQPSVYEQFMLELVNRARLNPNAEVERYYTIDLTSNPVKDWDYYLNNGLASGTINSDPKQPLVFNSHLLDSSRSHTQWMLDTNTFSHDENGTGLGVHLSDRLNAVGYNYSAAAENIASVGTTGTPDVNLFTRLNHENLFTSSGHRRNLLNDTYREIGIGSLEGAFQGYNSVVVTQNFGLSFNSAMFLTGVAFDDLVVDNNFYNVGEGLRGILVTAKNSSGQSFTTTTMDAGGYQLPLAAGTYNVTFSVGGTTVGFVPGVAISNKNVKVDFNSDSLLDIPGLNNNPNIGGTAGNDDLSGSTGNQTINGLGGNDRIYGAEGNDTILGDIGNDLLAGGMGNDSLVGGSGRDTLIGVHSLKIEPGKDETDQLRGNSSPDLFVLGDGNGAYYQYSTSLDKGIIRDFALNSDKILLYGSPSNYRLTNSSGSTKIYYGQAGTIATELIGIVERVVGLNQNGAEFNYADNALTITGTFNSELLSGGDTNQTLEGIDGNDTIIGGAGDDTVNGGNDLDILVGGTENDSLFGGAGNDSLTGVDPSSVKPGFNEIDRLQGGSDNDLFILGDISKAYYNHKTTPAQGNLDRAIIQDFAVSMDSIQLYGSASNYQLQVNGSNTNILYGNTGTTPQELIGTIEGVTGLSLSGAGFSYI
jgi:Ca2+-binding RTX toxin-like protein